MTAGHAATGTSPPPEPCGAQTVEELTTRLRQLQAWAGRSYRAIHRDVARIRAERGVPERPALNTVYRCFQPGRTRLDVELVVDIARALLGEDASAQVWRQACQTVAARLHAAAIVDVHDTLPDDPPSFAGRRAELRAIAELAAACRDRAVALVVVGMPGVGKTWLAVHAGHALQRAGRFADRQLAVDLRGYDPDRPPADPAAVLEGFLRRLGVPGEQIQHLDLAGRSARYRRLLAGRQSLVLLDNAASADQVLPLLPNTPGCLTLITSRHGLPGLPGAGEIPLEVFTRTEAMNLLRRAAGPDRVNADPAAAAGIATLLGHLPLALALTASRIQATPDWTLADHLDRLRQHRAGLRLDSGVEVAISTSYRGLPTEVARAFRLLTLHPGVDLEPFAVAALTGTELRTAHDVLDHLRSRHLLYETATGRFRFHDLVRVHAAARAQDEDAATARKAALARLLDHYAFAATTAMDHYAPHERAHRPRRPDPVGPLPRLTDRESATAWLDAERPNLVATALYAADHDRPDHTGHQSATLARYLHLAGHYQDATILHTRALDTADPTGQCRELGNLGNVSDRLGRPHDAIRLHRRAAALAEEIGDRESQSRALGNLGIAYWRLGRCREAIDHQLRALALYRDLGDSAGQGRTLINLGIVQHQAGRHDEAIDHVQRAQTIAHETGDHSTEALALNNLGVMLDRAGRHHEALHHQRRALTLARQMRNRAGEASTLNSLGDILERLGHRDEALRCQHQALALAQQIGNRTTEAYARASLGVLHRQMDRHSEALDHLHEGLAVAHAISERSAVTRLLNDLGETLRAAGRASEAVSRHEAALDDARDISDPFEQARAHHGLAEAASDLGDARTAHLHWREALRRYTELGAPQAGDVRARLRAPAGGPQ